MNKARENDHKVRIMSLNVQGLTEGKLFEVQKILAKHCEIMCLTETQQKRDKLVIEEGVKKIESMRELEDKKGGGLLILWKEKDHFRATITPTKCKDILNAEFKIESISLHITLVYFSVTNRGEDKIRNKKMRKEMEKIIGKLEDKNEMYLLLGDMNGHTGLIGQQKENENGKMIKDWMNDFGLVLLNLDEKCKGTYTWGRNDQKSVIDYALVNGHCYHLFSEMKIDEEREIFDLSDHNMITVELKLPKRRNTNFEKAKVITRTFLKTDDESLLKFSTEVDARLCGNVKCIKEVNDVITRSAKELLQAKYRKRVLPEKQVKEPPWITEEIKKKIKERRSVNRLKRNSRNAEEKELLTDMYQKKKKEVQIMVKDAITMNEKKNHR